MIREAQFIIFNRNDDVLHIKDTGDHSRCLTVTNDAEGVVARLHADGLLESRTLLYTDSDGEVSELKHDSAGSFIGYAPGPGR